MADARPTISTHVLDVERGTPAEGVSIALFWLTDDGGTELLAEFETDADGRVRDLLDGAALAEGDYQLVFDVGSYHGDEGFFGGMAVGIRVDDVTRSYHVPLLLSSFSMTTYRGS